MSEPAFPANVAAALDRLTMPPLPTGFADRLASRIATGDVPEEADTAMPRLRAPRRVFAGAGWRRTARIVGVVSAFGIATATAAASGAFGDPVYVPVVSETLARAQLVQLPKQAEAPRPATSRPQPAAAEQESEKATQPKGKAAVHDLYSRLSSDAEFKTLPRRERIARARAEARQMLREGVITPAELIEGLREIRAEQAPAARARIDAEIRRRVDNGTLRPEAAARIEQRLDEASARRAEPRQAPTPEAVAQRREAIRAMPPEQRDRLRDLRQQLRTAPPAERTAIRREIRSIWKSAGQGSDQSDDDPSEGNPYPVR